MKIFSVILIAMSLCACATKDSELDAAAELREAGADTAYAGSEHSPAEGGTPDDGPASGCGPGVYPCGPYGTEETEVVENFTFQGFADPDYLCKAPEDLVRDLSSLREISFKDAYLGGEGCAKKRLLWVMVSAGWCEPCQIEAEEIQAEFEKGAMDSRVVLLNVLFETDQVGTPITEEFAELWAYNSKFQLTYPVLLDPDFIMSKYFSKDATPFNMLVDLEDMTIYWREVGASLYVVGQAINEFFVTH